MGSAAYSGVVETARQYYNSDDADNFYFHVWGGEDIHIGIYESEDEVIAEASRRTVRRMAELVPGFDNSRSVLDIGAGYGGSARYLAGRYGCRVTALNLSETENERNRSMSAEQGLDSLIEVVDGSFEDIPAPDNSFDVVWSQDAILHSGHRDRVFAEVARVLKPGGDFIFTDPMQADDCPEGVLDAVLERIHLDSLGSVAFYRATAAAVGLEEVQVQALPAQLSRHYSRVRQELLKRQEELVGSISQAYVERMEAGLRNWVEAGEQGYLNWGILHFRKARSVQ